MADETVHQNLSNKRKFNDDDATNITANGDCSSVSDIAPKLKKTKQNAEEKAVAKKAAQEAKAAGRKAAAEEKAFTKQKLLEDKAAKKMLESNQNYHPGPYCSDWQCCEERRIDSPGCKTGKPRHHPYKHENGPGRFFGRHDRWSCCLYGDREKDGCKAGHHPHPFMHCKVKMDELKKKIECWANENSTQAQIKGIKSWQKQEVISFLDEIVVQSRRV